ncbi:MAG: hypothetical protein KR126chlam2_01366 [Chlamydiae bacterium]|nr:hypothetical protein [Chlamydiota bacterium]
MGGTTEVHEIDRTRIFGEQTLKMTEGFLDTPSKSFNVVFCPEVSCFCCCIGGRGSERLAAVFAVAVAVGSSIVTAVFALGSFAEALQCADKASQAQKQINPQDEASTPQLTPQQKIVYERSASLLQKKCHERVGVGLSQTTLAVGLGFLSVAFIFVLLEAETMALPIALPGIGLAGGGVVGYFGNATVYHYRKEKERENGQSDPAALRAALEVLRSPPSHVSESVDASTFSASPPLYGNGIFSC